MKKELDNTNSSLFKLGIYQHYRNKQRYEVIGTAKHSETLEKLVVYRALYGEGDIWVRPYEMFFENVVGDDGEVPRFRFIDGEK